MQLQKRLAGLKLLIIDELGFVPLSKTGAELLFAVFSQRTRGSRLLRGLVKPQTGVALRTVGGVGAEEEVKACLPDWLYATTPLVTRHNGFEVR